jgi:transposase
LNTETKPGRRKGRPNYSRDFKRRLAAAACETGVSVSKLAQAHQINANMVFGWRREYRAGLLDIGTAPALLPVALVTTPKETRSETAPARPAVLATGIIEIAIADAVVRVRGRADVDLLRTIFQSLRS